MHFGSAFSTSRTHGASHMADADEDQRVVEVEVTIEVHHTVVHFTDAAIDQRSVRSFSVLLQCELMCLARSCTQACVQFKGNASSSRGCYSRPVARVWIVLLSCVPCV